MNCASAICRSLCFLISFVFCAHSISWKIKEPPSDQKREEAILGGVLDLLIVPGVAFDSNLNRLGHGRGYYDTYIAKLESDLLSRGRLMIPLVAIGLSPQLVQFVPTSEYDRKMDHILLPKSSTADGFCKY